MRLYLSLFFLSLTSVFSLSAQQQSSNNARYLALGDSIPFGYDPQVQPPSTRDYNGYPEMVSRAIRQQVANISCFGETSGSFLGLGPDLGCLNWKSQGLPLHVGYASSFQTQMDLAVDLLARHKKKIQLITITIGGNDLGQILAQCTSVGGVFDPGCAQRELPVGLATYARNLSEILSRIRNTGYSGRIVAVTYYAFNYSPSDPFTPALAALNAVTAQVTREFGGEVADGFKAFGEASAPFGGDACLAGLLVRLPAGTCDTHPSEPGQKVLTSALISALSSSEGTTR